MQVSYYNENTRFLHVLEISIDQENSFIRFF